MNEDRQEHQKDLQRVEAHIRELDTSADQYAQAKLEAIDRALKRRRRNKRTKAQRPGDITMYQHLLNLRAAWANPQRRAELLEREREKVRKYADRIKRELA